MGETTLYIEENGRMLLYKRMTGFNIKALQTIALNEFGTPNKIKYKETSNRVLVYDDRTIHIEFNDTVGY